MPGTKLARACGKLQGALRSVNRFVSSTQQTPYGTLSAGLSLHSCLLKCAKSASFSAHRFNRPAPPRSAKAPQPKIPRSAPGSHAPTARGRSSWWCGDAPRSRNARARAPRRPRRRAASRRTRPIVHHRASAHPCAWRGPGPGRWRSWGQIVAHETTLRCLSDSCQLDSGLNELSRVRSITRRHGEVLSQVWCPGGWRPVIRVAGRAPLERGGGGVGRLAHRAGAPHRCLIGRRDARGVEDGPPPASRISPPDISQMSPEERATRLYNRVMLLHTQGKADSAEFFLPMALQAYAMLPALDVDARYHIGVLDLTSGDAAGALAQADTIRRAIPTHLFGFMLRARAFDLQHDATGARRAYGDFMKNEAAERARQRPEYGEHAQNLDAFHEPATQVTNGKAKRSS